MSEKQKYVKAISFCKSYIYGLVGLNSGILPGHKLRLSYSDSTNRVFNVEESNHSVTENPLTGMVDVVIKLSLKKEEYNETDSL